MRKRGKPRNFKPLFIFLYVGLFVGFIVAVFQLFPVLNKLTHLNQSDELVAPYKQHASRNDFETQLIQKRIEYESIQVSSDSAVLVVQLKDGGPKVYFSSYEDPEWQVNSLQTILTRLTIEKTPGGHKKPRIIDMRLAKPVVKF